MIIKELEKEFAEFYGSDYEVVLPRSILIIRDDYPSTHCSGANGYITKVRFHEGEIEFYVDWWSGGWTSKPKASWRAKILALKQALEW